MAKITIDRRDTLQVSTKVLGLFVYLKCNLKKEEQGLRVDYDKIKHDTGLNYKTLKLQLDELEAKGYIRLYKKGIPPRVYAEFLK